MISATKKYGNKKTFRLAWDSVSKFNSYILSYIHFLISHKFWQKVGITFLNAISNQPECFLVSILWLAHACFHEIAFVHDIGASLCVSAPKAINYIHMIFNLCNQLKKFVTFRNITKQFLHGYSHWYEANCDGNQPYKAMLVP